MSVIFARDKLRSLGMVRSSMGEAREMFSKVIQERLIKEDDVSIRLLTSIIEADTPSANDLNL